jgi:hypothetical protein
MRANQYLVTTNQLPSEASRTAIRIEVEMRKNRVNAGFREDEERKRRL